jgi:hypothetical protein
LYNRILIALDKETIVLYNLIFIIVDSKLKHNGFHSLRSICS